MLNMIWQELKRLFLRKSTLLFLLLIILINFLALSPKRTANELNNINERAEYSDTMELLEGRELYDYKKSIIHKYAGVINQKWINMIHSDYQNELVKASMKTVDEEAMLERYGANWEQEFKNNPEAYEDITKDKEVDGVQIQKGKQPFYVNDYAITARGSVLYDIINETEALINKEWNNPEKETYKNSDGETITYLKKIPNNIAESPERLRMFQDKMNRITEFYYDDSSGWNTLMSDIAEARFLLALMIIFLTSRCFNSDYSAQTIDIIKVTKLGKQKVVFAKLIAILLTCIFTTLAYTAIFAIVNYTMFGLGNWNVNATALSGFLSPYTYKEAFLGGVAILLCGSITIGFLSAGLSVFFKKSYVTFALGLLIYILPIAIPNDLVKLFPVNYMDFSGIYFYSEMMKFMNHYIFTPTIIYGISMVILLLCCVIIVPRYRSYAMTKE